MFLKLGFTIWAILIVGFIVFSFYIYRQPDEYIDKIKAQAIENKKKLGIKIYRMH
jgi:hypothetical protein